MKKSVAERRNPFAGLNLPSGSICKLYCLHDEFIFEARKQETHLSIRKIQSITMLKNIDIQQQIVSNAGGAIAGAMMGGAIGALIGGVPIDVTAKRRSKSLVITYQGATGCRPFFSIGTTTRA